MADLKRYAMKRDENEEEIVLALESCGCTVHRLDSPVDLLVGRGKRNILIEVKNPNKPKADRQKTEAQRTFFSEWQGQVAIVETIDQAIELVTKLTVKNAL